MAEMPKIKMEENLVFNRWSWDGGFIFLGLESLHLQYASWGAFTGKRGIWILLIVGVGARFKKLFIPEALGRIFFLVPNSSQSRNDWASFSQIRDSWDTGVEMLPFFGKHLGRLALQPWLGDLRAVILGHLLATLASVWNRRLTEVSYVIYSNLK